MKALLLSLVFITPLVAAPPTVTTLTPAGGQRGTTAAVTATGTFDRWPVRAWCDTPGVSVTAEKAKGKFRVAVAADAPLGVAWLRFHDDTGASPPRPFVVGGLPEVAETEPNNDARTAPPVPLPAVVNGVLAKSGDVDCFAFKLKKGETLVASLDANRTLAAPMDAVLQILAADGTVLEQNHDARGLDPETTYTAAADGTYLVRLFAFPSQPNSTIRHFGSPACVYRLTLTAGEFVDFATPLAVEAGREVELTLHGWNLKAKAVTLGKSHDAIGVAHRFPLAREPHPCFDLTGGPADRPLSPPFTATGRVATAGGVSVLNVATKAKQPLTIRLDSAPLGLALTPVLRITDAVGKQLLRAEPAKMHGPLETTFNPPTAGPFRIEVRDLFAGGGPRHVYRLTLTSPTPDVTATVAADRFTLAAGKPLDIPITLTRKGGLKDDLIPYADTLPDGVTASLASPSPKPAANTVVLRLTATKPVSGPIRIGVRKPGDDFFRRLATATVPEFDRATPDLWLTATDAK